MHIISEREKPWVIIRFTPIKRSGHSDVIWNKDKSGREAGTISVSGAHVEGVASVILYLNGNFHLRPIAYSWIDPIITDFALTDGNDLPEIGGIGITLVEVTNHNHDAFPLVFVCKEEWIPHLRTALDWASKHVGDSDQEAQVLLASNLGSNPYLLSRGCHIFTNGAPTKEPEMISIIEKQKGINEAIAGHIFLQSNANNIKGHISDLIDQAKSPHDLVGLALLAFVEGDDDMMQHVKTREATMADGSADDKYVLTAIQSEGLGR